MKTVPKEPTEEMLKAGARAFQHAYNELDTLADWRAAYQAMLAAAPASDGEAVAWRWRTSKLAEWKHCGFDPTPTGVMFLPSDELVQRFEKEPLYTTPRNPGSGWQYVRAVRMCEKHQGQSFTMTVSAPNIVGYYCPLCEPPIATGAGES